MGLLEFLQQWRGGRATFGVAVSILLHLLVVLALFWGGNLPFASSWKPKPGDALIVELPKPEESPAPGVPDAPATPPDASAPPTRAASPPKAPPAPPAPPTARPAPPAPRQVASAPRPAEPARPAPRASEAPRPAEPPADSGADKAAPAPAAAQTPATDTPKVERVPPGPPSNPQVASVPPGGAPSGPTMPDMRSALRRGAGGRGAGRGGIEGDAVPLDSKDDRFSDFLEKVRQKIKANWGYPCVKNHSTRECEYLSAQLIVEFGILKSGELQFVEVLRPSGYAIYDGYAVTAIRLASPYPKVPAQMMEQMKAGSTGTVIVAKFNYIASDTSLTNIR